MTKTYYKVIEPIGKLHPGEVISEYMDTNHWNQSELAARTGLTQKTVSEICNKKAPITPRTALTLERVFNRPAHFWLNLQRQYDEELARINFQNMSKLWTNWSRKFPVEELQELKLIPGDDSERSEVELLLSYFRVSSPEGWKRIWDSSRISFRQTRKLSTSIECISAWIQATEYYSEPIKISEYSEQGALDAITLLRNCTSRNVQKGIDEAQSICASVGIKLLIVPAFSHTEISGCARWLTPKTALIALSNRYQSDDHFWFTFFHELAHILLHRKTLKFVIDNAVENVLDKVVDPQIQRQEDEANRFAADTLIPPIDLAEFIRNAKYSNDSIKKFSEYLGIAPGIIVGRLQHEELLEPHQGNVLKQKIELGVE